MITFRLLTTADVNDLAPRLRNEDQEECIVLGSNPREALLMGAFDNFFPSSKGAAYAIESEQNGLIGAIGFTTSGYLWALSTPFAFGDLKELYRRTPEILAWLLTEARRKGVFANGASITEPYFENLIHARNATSLKWLSKCGDFLVFKDDPVEVDGQTFYPFRSKVPSEKTPACAYH